MRIITWDKNTKINEFIIYEYKYEKYPNNKREGCVFSLLLKNYINIIKLHIHQYDYLKSLNHINIIICIKKLIWSA